MNWTKHLHTFVQVLRIEGPYLSRWEVYVVSGYSSRIIELCKIGSFQHIEPSSWTSVENWPWHMAFKWRTKITEFLAVNVWLE